MSGWKIIRISYEFMRPIDQISCYYYVVKFVHFELLRTRVYKAVGLDGWHPLSYSIACHLLTTWAANKSFQQLRGFYRWLASLVTISRSSPREEIQ